MPPNPFRHTTASPHIDRSPERSSRENRPPDARRRSEPYQPPDCIPEARHPIGNSMPSSPTPASATAAVPPTATTGRCQVYSANWPATRVGRPARYELTRPGEPRPPPRRPALRPRNPAPPRPRLLKQHNNQLDDDASLLVRMTWPRHPPVPRGPTGWNPSVHRSRLTRDTTASSLVRQRVNADHDDAEPCAALLRAYWLPFESDGHGGAVPTHGRRHCLNSARD